MTDKIQDELEKKKKKAKFVIFSYAKIGDNDHQTWTADNKRQLLGALKLIIDETGFAHIDVMDHDAWDQEQKEDYPQTQLDTDDLEETQHLATKQAMTKDEIEFYENELWHLEHQHENPREFKKSIKNIKERLTKLKGELK